MIRLIKGILIIWCLLCPVLGRANYMFKHYGVENGLSQSTGYAILQDRTGFIWIGTKAGLNRYDGTNFKVYRAQADSHSLGSDFVTALYEDGDGNIWIGTDTGVWIYHPLTDSFSRFSVRSNYDTMVSGLVNVIEGNKDAIYIAANEQGVFRYDLRRHTMTQERLADFPNVSGLTISHDGTLWIGFFGGGLYSADALLKHLSPFTTAANEQPLRSDIISSVLEFKPGLLFVGSDKNGLSAIDVQKGMVSPIVNSYQGNNIFVRKLVARGQEIWAASEMGLFVYNLKNKSVQHYVYDASNPFSLSDNPLYSLFQDKEGGMWMGSYFGGINYLPNRIPMFRLFVPQEDGLRGRRIRELVQDDNGIIWVGTEDAGLNRFNPATGQFSFVAASAAFPNVHGLCVDGDKLWVGTFSYGLKLIDIRSGAVVKSFTASNQPGDLRDNTVFSICKSSNGDVYLGTIRGLCRYNRQTSHFDYEKEVPAVLVNDVFFDSKGNLWIATQTNGVYWKKKGSEHWISMTTHDDSGLTSDKVLQIFEDSAGHIWISTQGGGVCLCDITTGKVKRFMIGKDNIGATVFQVVEDTMGQLWFTTYGGLVCYNPATQQIRKYTNANLLLTNQFNYSSSLLARDGRLYLGSLSGLLCCSPKQYANNQHLPKLVATELRIGNEVVTNFTKNTPLEQNIVFTRELSLAHDQNTFSLCVSALDYDSSVGLDIEYMLEGYDREWQPMRTDHIIAYSNLPAGTYTLRCRVKVGDTQWSTNGYTLTVTVRPHFLLSVWAKLFYLLVAVVLGWQICCYLLKRSRHKREWAIKQFEHKKEQELYESKIHFFTNVAHEIRTPLTLIKGPLEDIIGGGRVTDPMVKEDLSIMHQNTVRLTDLINQLLDFRKMERDRLQLNFEKCNINKLVTEVYDRFRSVMRERNINSTISMQGGTLYAYVDYESLTKVVSNLINNAVKYCASRVSVMLSTDGNDFCLVVKNDGNLIPNDMREKIFQPFFRLDENQQTTTTGTGIGLALAKSLAELHGGTLAMVDDDTMNVFQLTLPIEQKVMVDLKQTSVEDMETMPVDASKKYTLLLVEDNQQMRDYEKRKLQVEYNILTASDGEEALAVLAQHTVHLVVTDVMMEPMNGLELLKRIKHESNFSYIPVVLLTALTTDSAKLEGMENGADAYIDKPFSMTFLMETIQNLLRQRESIRKAYAGSPFVKASSVSISTADSDFLQHLKEAVNKNLSNSDFSVDLLAAEMKMSRTSLNRKIRGTLDLSPNNYIRLERLKEAARLLQEGKSRINEVCYRVGFTSPSYFTKCFYQQFGLLPKEFLKEQNDG